MIHVVPFGSFRLCWVSVEVQEWDKTSTMQRSCKWRHQTTRALLGEQLLQEKIQWGRSQPKLLCQLFWIVACSGSNVVVSLSFLDPILAVNLRICVPDDHVENGFVYYTSFGHRDCIWRQEKLQSARQRFHHEAHSHSFRTASVHSTRVNSSSTLSLLGFFQIQGPSWCIFLVFVCSRKNLRKGRTPKKKWSAEEKSQTAKSFDSPKTKWKQ